MESLNSSSKKPAPAMHHEFFLEKLEKTVEANYHETFASWYNDKGKESQSQTFGQIWDEAGIIAHYLLNVWEVKRGERVVLCYGFGLHFFASFLGCLRAGITAVLVYPPRPPLSQSLPVMNKIIQDCSPKLVLMCKLVEKYRFVDAKANLASKTRKLWPKNIEFKATENLIAPATKTGLPLFATKNTLSPNHVAFLQYTSGSTGEPKGVKVTTSSLQANLQVLLSGFDGSFASDGGIPGRMVGFSWLPQYHDLGLLLTVLPFVQGWTMHLMSPVTFIQNPVLWIELMSQCRVNWSVAPDFAIRLVARKYLEHRRNVGNEKNNHIKDLDLSTLYKIQVCAEPVQPDTKKLFDNVFGKYGLREDWFKVGYGLAEHVVGIGWIVGVHRPVVHSKATSDSVVAVASKETLHPSVKVKIVDPDTQEEVKDGTTGELWVAGPSVTGGYWNKAELSEKTFRARLEVSKDKAAGDSTYLRTGDVAFWDDNGNLFICGRIKDLVIVNGVNYYPQDIEAAVQDASAAVRPGCVAAFSSSDTADDLEIVFEIREAFEKDTMSVVKGLQQSVTSTIGLIPSRLVAIKERTIPKTTSGKIRRKPTRENLHEGKLSVVFEIRNKEAPTDINAFVLPEDLPTDTLPSSVFDAVRSVALDAELLETYFHKAGVNDLPGVLEAWKIADKSDRALMQVCESSLKALQANFPALVQFLNLLEDHTEWILPGDDNHLTRLVHCVFVLNWVTKKLAPDRPHEESLLEAKVQQDDDLELLLAQELGIEPASLPAEAQFLADGKPFDTAFEAVDTFVWLKQRSVRLYAKFLYSRKTDQEYRYDDGDFHLGVLNVLEAVWLDQQRGYVSNASVGHWLAARAGHAVAIDNRFLAKRRDWTSLYASWNMAFITSLDCTPGFQEWVIAKHCIPCVASASPENFFKYRVTALYLVSQLGFMDELRGERRSSGWLSNTASDAFGLLNRRLVCSRDYDDSIDWDDPLHQENPNSMIAEWLRRFDAWSGREIQERECTTQDQKVDVILDRILGPDVDPDMTWDEIGLSSMVSVQLRDSFTKNFSTKLSSSCFESYRTPRELKNHIMHNKGHPIPTKLRKLQTLDDQHIRWILAGSLQAIGALMLLLLFAFSFLPAYYVGKVLASVDALTTDLEVGGRWVRWRWLPLVIPVWATSFSLIVCVMKWIVIGKYREGSIVTPSVGFLRWWFIDRFVHLWEIWVGRFILDTPLIWLFYHLLGARIDISVQVNTFIREFDLVQVGERSKIKQTIRCRVFAPWQDSEKGPRLRFRAISIGKNCSIEGFLQPGTSVGDFASIEKLSVIQEGSQVPSGISALGNPAFNVGSTTETISGICWWKLGAFKLAWLVIELYVFFALVFVGQITWNDRLPLHWRYTPLLFWFLLILETEVLSVLVSVILKWVLIGRRRPGPFKPSLWREMADWACDYHYRISVSLVVYLLLNSKVWNLILMAHGMDIDFYSIVDPMCFLPSNVDLISMKRSMSTQATFEAEKDNAYHQSNIRDGSSIGYESHVGPGVSVAAATVPPYTYLSEDAIGTTGKRSRRSLTAAEKRISRGEMNCSFLYAVFVCLFFLSLIPPYEIMALAIDHNVAFASVPALAAAFLIHTVVAFLLLFCFGLIAVGKRRTVEGQVAAPYRVYHSLNYATQDWSIQSLIWGTPFYPWIMKFLGAKVEGRLLFFGFRFYDPTFLIFKDRTVIDDSNISGHNVTYRDALFSDCTVSGVVQRTFTMAGAIATEEKSGPFRALIPASFNDVTYRDIEKG